MAGDMDDEDYIFFGTPLEREEELKPHKRKEAVEKGQVRTLPVWKQEVTDEDGKRRFHGAFTGGFSAGYFNTVGSKEGWTPSTFTSSRSNRAARKEQQSAYDFMDADEREALDSRALTASSYFDTFGSTAADVARRQAASSAAAKGRPSVIPGPVPDELVVLATESIGVKLLKKMGWRHGRAVGPKHEAASARARRFARQAMLAFASSQPSPAPAPAAPSSSTPPPLPPGEGMPAAAKKKVYGVALPPPPPPAQARKVAEEGEEEEGEEEVEVEAEVEASTPLYVLNPKSDFHGLGYDPFKSAPEFRAAKRARAEPPTAAPGGGGRRASGDRGSLFRPRAGTMGAGIGLGALEDIGQEDEDIYGPELVMELGGGASEEEDNDDDNGKEGHVRVPGASASGGAGRGGAGLPRGPVEIKPARLQDDTLPGFALGSSSAVADDFKWFAPPAVPRSFVPRHTFPPAEQAAAAPSSSSAAAAAAPATPPPECTPPADAALRSATEGLAAFVARAGQQFEDLAREKNASNPVFSFLSGGPGCEYYKRRLWELRQKRAAQQGQGQGHAERLEGEREGEKEREREREGRETRGGRAPGGRQVARLDAEGRGRVLGEKALPRQQVAVEASIDAGDRARLQADLASQFTTSTGQEATRAVGADFKPFAHDAAKQARFEQYLRDQSRGGLRRGGAFGSVGLSERERAFEVGEFERASAMLKQGRALAAGSSGTAAKGSELAAILGSKFTTAGGSEKLQLVSLPSGLATANEVQAAVASAEGGLPPGGSAGGSGPVREEEAWRPLPLLCKRFNLADPHAGKGPAPPKQRSRTDSLALLAPPGNAAAAAVTTAAPSAALSMSLLDHPGAFFAGLTTPAVVPSPQSASAAAGLSSPLALPGPPGADTWSRQGAPGSGGLRAVGGEAKEAEAAEEEVEKLEEKPIDLFKAIFSDDESDEEEDEEEIAASASAGAGAGSADVRGFEHGRLPAAAAAAAAAAGAATAGRRGVTAAAAEAATAALSRLEAGDFLESLGAELGLDVPLPALPAPRPPPPRAAPVAAARRDSAPAQAHVGKSGARPRSAEGPLHGQDRRAGPADRWQDDAQRPMGSRSGAGEESAAAIGGAAADGGSGLLVDRGAKAGGMYGTKEASRLPLADIIPPAIVVAGKGRAEEEPDAPEAGGEGKKGRRRKRSRRKGRAAGSGSELTSGEDSSSTSRSTGGSESEEEDEDDLRDRRKRRQRRKGSHRRSSGKERKKRRAEERTEEKHRKRRQRRKEEEEEEGGREKEKEVASSSTGRAHQDSPPQEQHRKRRRKRSRER